jgi:hypothetical protein
VRVKPLGSNTKLTSIESSVSTAITAPAMSDQRREKQTGHISTGGTYLADRTIRHVCKPHGSNMARTNSDTKFSRRQVLSFFVLASGSGWPILRNRSGLFHDTTAVKRLINRRTGHRRWPLEQSGPLNVLGGGTRLKQERRSERLHAASVTLRKL